MYAEKLVRKVAKSYATALRESVRASTEFSREYWKGKAFGIVETYSELAMLTWAEGERKLKANLPKEKEAK